MATPTYTPEQQRDRKALHNNFARLAAEYEEQAEMAKTDASKVYWLGQAAYHRRGAERYADCA